MEVADRWAISRKYRLDVAQLRRESAKYQASSLLTS
jgi:hypothetical protein